MAGRKRPEYRYELLTCAWRGHELVGQQAAVVTPADAIVVRESDGQRWCRCLRCDGWFAVPVPDRPVEERVPTRDEIDLPLRGPALRDRYVLRLIALDRVVHVVILTFLAVAFVTFASHNRALHADYQNIMNALNGGERPPPGSAASSATCARHSTTRRPIFTSWRPSSSPTPAWRRSRRSGCGSTGGGPST